MQKAERCGIAIPQTDIKPSLQSWTGSRRDFMRFASGAAITGTTLGAGVLYSDEARELYQREFEGRSAREEFERYVQDQGYEKEADALRRRKLLGDVGSFIALPIEMHTLLDEDGLVDVTFTTEDPEYVVLTVEGEHDEIGSLPVVTAEFQGMEYVVPIFQTRYENSQSIALKTVSPDNHVIRFRKTHSSDELGEEDIAVSVKTPDKLTPFGQAVLDCLPILGMQKEFAFSDVFDNDAPYFRDVKIFEHTDNDKIRVAFFEGRTAEDGGIGEDPIQMYKNLGRLFDYDHSVIVTIGREDGLVYEIAHQEDRYRSHRIDIDRKFSTGVDPKDVDEMFHYHSVPDHGMVKRGLERKSNGELLHNRIYSIYPDLNDFEDSDILEERLRVRKLIGVQEHKRELEQFISEQGDWILMIERNGYTPLELTQLQFLIEQEQRLLAA